MIYLFITALLPNFNFLCTFLNSFMKKKKAVIWTPNCNILQFTEVSMAHSFLASDLWQSFWNTKRREKRLDFRSSLTPTDSDRCWVGSSKSYQNACKKMILAAGFITKHFIIHWNILEKIFLWYKASFNGTSEQAKKQTPPSQSKREEL